MGSAKRYESDGKARGRVWWHQLSRDLSRQLKRSLSAFWLSNDEFTDLKGMCRVFDSVYVPENDEYSLRKKRSAVKASRTLSRVVELPDHSGDASDYLYHLKETIPNIAFDVINLDYCIHFSPNVVQTIGAIVRQELLRKGGLLFMTVSTVTQANRHPDIRYKSLARKLDRVNELVIEEVERNGSTAAGITGFPFEYKNKTASMLSYGWRIGSAS